MSSTFDYLKTSLSQIHILYFFPVSEDLHLVLFSPAGMERLDYVVEMGGCLGVVDSWVVDTFALG